MTRRIAMPAGALLIAVLAVLGLALVGNTPSSASARTTSPHVLRVTTSTCTYAAYADYATGNAGYGVVHLTENTCGLRWVSRIGCHANVGGITAWHSGPTRYGTGQSTANCANGSYPYEIGFDIWNNAGTKFWNELWPTTG